MASLWLWVSETKEGREGGVSAIEVLSRADGCGGTRGESEETAKGGDVTVVLEGVALVVVVAFEEQQEEEEEAL